MLNVWSTHQFWVGFLRDLGIEHENIVFSSDTSEEQGRDFGKGRGTVDWVRATVGSELTRGIGSSLTTWATAGLAANLLASPGETVADSALTSWNRLTCWAPGA